MLLLQAQQAIGEAVQTNFFDNLWLSMKDKVLAGEASFFENIYKEIYNNIILDDRYMGYLEGLGVTLKVSFFAALIGIVLGTILALMRLSNVKILGFNPLSKFAGLYITVFRGTPLLLQVLIIYFGVFGSIKIDKTLAGIIACGLNSAAYVAEIIRGGILSVDKGQSEAGRSLGLSGGQTMRFIIFPQAFKSALPALCNEFIVLIKETSILAYVAVTDLTKAADYVRSRTFSTFTPYLVAAALYLIVIVILTKLLRRLEERLRQGDNR